MSDARVLQHVSLLVLLTMVALSANARAGTPRPMAGALDATTVHECHGDAASSNWWTGFNDAALNLLHALAAGRSAVKAKPTAAQGKTAGCEPAELTAAYVQLRVLALRSLIAHSVLETTAHQDELLRRQASQADAALDVLAARRERARSQTRELELQRLHLIQVLVERTGLGEQQLVAALTPALGEHSVPRFQMVMPQRLPTSPAEEPEAPADRASKLRSAVARDLRTLIERGNAAVTQGQLVASRRVEFESTRQRQQLGQAGELEAAERYYMMLVDTDRLAAINGEVALAWIQLQRRTGGTLQVGPHGEARIEPGLR
jgi:hypothetical protein